MFPPSVTPPKTHPKSRTKITCVLVAAASSLGETPGNQRNRLQLQRSWGDVHGALEKGVKFTLRPTEQWGVMQAKLGDPDGNEFSPVEG
jgi:hypothetical protein